jgi:predicted lipoprotein with Yx(FWY)xxD motif
VSRSIYTVVLAAIAAALVVAGCGGGSSSSSTSGSTGGAYGNGSSSNEEGGSKSGASAPASNGSEEKPASSATGEAVNISLASGGDLGMILVEGKGMTVYDFHKDKGGTPMCYGACTQIWPPVLTTSAPQPGNGASASMLGTVERKDGTMQVTYAGHPLYTYLADKKPGETNGNDVTDFGAQWYALMGNGEEPEDS